MLLLFSTLRPTVPSEENELISILLSESPVLLNTLEMIRIGYFLLPAKSSIRNYLNLNRNIFALYCFLLKNKDPNNLILMLRWETDRKAIIL